ncbi:MAG: hypothetical protein HOQ35_00445 [Acidobacteriaceae bacterium]|nr:hypothetical protein [Acidobacteriaceae bacterium]
MKRLVSIACQSLLALLLGSVETTTLEAEYDPGVTVRSPFAFTAGGQNMEAGVYVIEQSSERYVLSFVDVKTGQRRLLAMNPGRQQTGEQHGQLIFLDCGGRSVLTEVHIPGSDMSSKLRDLMHSDAKSCSSTTRTSIAMR